MWKRVLEPFGTFRSIGESVRLLEDGLAMLPYKDAAGEVIAANVWLQVRVYCRRMSNLGRRTGAWTLGRESSADNDDPKYELR
jgi:hypothetical protein